MQRVLVALALVFLPGSALADKAPPPREPPPRPVHRPADPPPPPPPARRLDDPRPKRLPDGVFLGKLVGTGDPSRGDGADVRVTIVGGQVIEAYVRRAGGLPIIDLAPFESGRSIALQLRGAVGEEFVELSGAFFDAERGAGRFEGVLARKKVTGTWLLARR